MKTMLYQSPYFFDKHGNAKPYFLFWLSCIFLARAWIVFVIAGVSGEQSQKLLSLFYPDSETLYIGFAIGFPAVVFMLLAGNVHCYPVLFEQIWRRGRGILILAFCADLIVQMDHLIIVDWRFHWSRASMLLIALWMVIYCFKSRRIQFLFGTPISREFK